MSPPARSVSPLLLVCCVVSLTACDDRCNKLDCGTLFNDCGQMLTAEPNYARCNLRRSDDTDRPYEGDRNYRCAQACVASDRGEVLECVDESWTSCRDSSTAGARLLASCESRLPSVDAACRQRCTEERTKCDAACPGPPDAGSGDCLDCVSRCGLAWGRCDVGCRSGS